VIENLRKTKSRKEKILYYDCLTLILCAETSSAFLTEFPYRPEIVDEAGLHFDHVVEQILNKDYEIKKVPENKVCKECDLRVYCGREEVFRLGQVDDSILSGQG